MPHFTARFGLDDERDLSGAAWDRLEALYRQRLGEDELERHGSGDASVLVAGRGDERPRFHRSEAGWVVVLGLLCDVGSRPGEADLERLLGEIAGCGEPAFDRYEGTFALAAWDARTRTAWAWNDQASCLNLYFSEHGGALWVTTSVLVLARALGSKPDPCGAAELLARGTVLAPRTLFAGTSRLNLGEHLRRHDGHTVSGRHWSPYRQPVDGLGTRQAAEALVDLVTDRVTRLGALRRPIVADLTGGYDSRLAASATHAAGLLAGTTVDGPPEHDDVRYAAIVARAAGWPLRHFDTEVEWTRPITAGMRAELVYRTGGELAFTEVYHHLLTRPRLARDYRLHVTGGGGELLRSFPWSHEFLGIGRRRPANVGRALRYRFLQEGPPPGGLFADQWFDALGQRLAEGIRALFDAGRGTRTTQQCDAVYLWRMTGFAAYTSSVFSWLPSTAPLMCAGVVDAALALPWRLRLTAGLWRRRIGRMAPAAAAAATRYGGPAGPVRPGNLHLELRQLARQARHLAVKVDRVRFGGRLTGWLPTPAPDPRSRKPWSTDEFRARFDPPAMRTRNLYRHDGLARLLAAGGADAGAGERMVLRVATLELVCDELDFEPDPGFLAPEAVRG